MQLLIWFFALLFLTLAIWSLSLCRRQHRQLNKLKKSLKENKAKLHQLKESYKHNVSSRESKEDRLRSYLLLLDSVINTIPAPIYFKDAQGAYQGCNKVFAKQILGLTRDHIIGRRPQNLPDQIPPDLAATYQRHENIMSQNGRPHSFEAQVQCADGLRRDFLFNLAPITDEGNELNGCVAVLSDLTEKNRAALDRLQKEKLQGVLETAGAVCHEFNQPLQALSGYIEILTTRGQGEEKLMADLEKIVIQIERMSAITTKLHNITRYETTDYAGNTKIIDINKASE